MSFDDSQLRVYTSTIVSGGAPVLLVFHDDDGDWQFLASTERQADEIAVAHIGHLLDADSTLHQLADLPRGWKAWRETASDPWEREPTPDDQAEL